MVLSSEWFNISQLIVVGGAQKYHNGKAKRNKTVVTQMDVNDNGFMKNAGMWVNGSFL